MGVVDKVLGGLRDKEVRQSLHNENESRHETGPEALALGKPAEYTVDDKIGGTHTRTVKDAVVHENVVQHAHHEVTPIVNREREETEIHQKVQPIIDQQEHHTHHQHVAPQVSRHVQEDIREDHAKRYAAQGQHQHQQVVNDQTHSTSVNAPIVREHVNKHIVEEIQPIIQRQTQKVEHHHTTQQINETHVKAPVVHETVTAPAISMAEFAGKVGDLTLGQHGSHGHGQEQKSSAGGAGAAASSIAPSATTGTTGASSSLLSGSHEQHLGYGHHGNRGQHESGTTAGATPGAGAGVGAGTAGHAVGAGNAKSGKESHGLSGLLNKVTSRDTKTASTTA